jgi:hypothetical protein
VKARKKKNDMKVKGDLLGILRGERERTKRVIEVVKMIKVYYMHVWKYHNETIYLYNRW